MMCAERAELDKAESLLLLLLGSSPLKSQCGHWLVFKTPKSVQYVCACLALNMHVHACYL